MQQGCRRCVSSIHVISTFPLVYGPRSHLFLLLFPCFDLQCIPHPQAGPSTHCTLSGWHLAVLVMPPYNEVNLSLRLGQGRKRQHTSPPVAPAQQLTVGQNPAQWPDSLKEFVNTSFVRAAHLPPQQNFEFQQQLEKLMEQAISLNRLWENDWLAQQIPILDGGLLELECTRRPPVKEHEKEEFDSNSRKRLRQSRFERERSASPAISAQNLPHTPLPLSHSSTTAAIVGRSQALEKNYLRLTTEPDPYLVRPQAVLEKSIEFVLNRFRTEGKDYSYINNQFKSIRQDLTVQHIKNDFTMVVYETHARIALENNDLGEFNQCQSQLSYLIRDLKRQGNLLEKGRKLELEFTCYRIIYMVMTGNHSDINRLRCEWGERGDWIQKAFSLQQCQLVGDYHRFFALYDTFSSTMPLAKKLIQQHLLVKERIRALSTMSRAYRRISLAFLETELKFEPGEDTLAGFLSSHKLESYVVGADLDMALARDTINGIVVKTGFRKIDIKGQI